MNKNRFIIFSGDTYYPPENGISCGAPTLEEAIAKIQKKNKYGEDEAGNDAIFVDGCEYGRDWAYIVDSETLETVFEISA